jgi:hypothetical protein
MEHCRGCGAPGTARELVPVMRERPLRRAVRLAACRAAPGRDLLAPDSGGNKKGKESIFPATLNL